ncbi:MAG: ROK family protein [Bryobacteraceae bacterium]|jgi:hypothetical protein
MESHILEERMRNLAESLFWEIFCRREAVRAELAGLFQVSAATVSRAVGILLSKLLVIEIGAPVAYRGRRPTLLRINPRLAYVGGIEMDRDRITAVVTDLGGNLLGRGATAASPGNAVEATLRDAAKVLRIAMKGAGLRQLKLARIGVGHTGTLDVENGLCLDWEGVSHWRRLPLAEALRATFKTEITLDDRARAVALALHLTWPKAAGIASRSKSRSAPASKQASSWTDECSVAQPKWRGNRPPCER